MRENRDAARAEAEAPASVAPLAPRLSAKGTSRSSSSSSSQRRGRSASRSPRESTTRRRAAARQGCAPRHGPRREEAASSAGGPPKGHVDLTLAKQEIFKDQCCQKCSWKKLEETGRERSVSRSNSRRSRSRSVSSQVSKARPAQADNPMHQEIMRQVSKNLAEKIYRDITTTQFAKKEG